MENKIKSKLLPALFIMTFIAVGYFFIRFTVNTIKPDSTKTSPPKDIEINKEIYDKLTTPKDNDTVISPDKDGFGRADPFLPYK